MDIDWTLRVSGIDKAVICIIQFDGSTPNDLFWASGPKSNLKQKSPNIDPGSGHLNEELTQGITYIALFWVSVVTILDTIYRVIAGSQCNLILPCNHPRQNWPISTMIINMHRRLSQLPKELECHSITSKYIMAWKCFRINHALWWNLTGPQLNPLTESQWCKILKLFS